MFATVALVLAIVFAAILISTPVVSWINVSLLLARRRGGTERAPHVNVVVPCAAFDEETQNNLRALASQTYPDYRLTVVTDLGQDFPPLDVFAGGFSHVRHVVADIATRGAQKSHAQLAGILSDPDARIFVVIDASMHPRSDWLREMVRPFADPGIGAVTTRHWIRPEQPGIVPALFTVLAGYLTTFVGLPGMGWLWGGCFAMRRELFDELDIAGSWERTVSDDTTLQRRLNAAHIRPVFAPAAMAPATETPGTLSGFVRWFARQAHAGRLYLKPYWAVGLVFVTAAVAVLVGSIVAAIGAVALPSLRSVLPPALVVLGSTMVSGALVKLPHIRRKDIALALWITIPLIGFPLVAAAAWRSAFMAKVRWGGATYEVSRDGIVQRVLRAPQGRRA